MGAKRSLTETRFIITVEDFDQLEDAMLTAERDVAKKLNIKPCTLRNERLQGAISFVKIRSRYFYTEEQVEEYIRSKTSRLTMPPQPPAIPTPTQRHISPTPLDELRSASRAAALRSAMETFKRGPRSPNRRKDG
jgi:hypothetical protein